MIDNARASKLRRVVRGVIDDGSDLVVWRDYISHGLRSRAEDLLSAELDPRPEHDIRSALERAAEAEQCTRLAAAIRMAADDIGFIGLRSIVRTDPGFRPGNGSWAAQAAR
jgi:type IV secretory pathway VirD2 relaxase